MDSDIKIKPQKMKIGNPKTENAEIYINPKQSNTDNTDNKTFKKNVFNC